MLNRYGRRLLSLLETSTGGSVTVGVRSVGHEEETRGTRELFELLNFLNLCAQREREHPQCYMNDCDDDSVSKR